MDHIVIGLVRDGRIRVYAVNSTQSTREICKLHNTTPVVSDALARTLSVGAMMGKMLKNGKLTIKVQGNGPIKLILVDATFDGTIRGLVGKNDVDLPLKSNGKLDVGAAVGDLGVLTVIKNNQLKQNFSGDVILQSGEIGEDFSYYFLKSEQVPSVVSVGAIIGRDLAVECSGGLIIQLMPSATDDDFEFVENLAKKLGPVTAMINKHHDMHKVLLDIFPDIRILSRDPIKFECTCSKERFIAGIATLEKSEIEDMIKVDNGCEIRCDFCNRYYYLSEADLQKSIDLKVGKKKN
jgi:molecular chaperone Hsp33